MLMMGKLHLPAKLRPNMDSATTQIALTIRMPRLKQQHLPSLKDEAVVQDFC